VTSIQTNGNASRIANGTAIPYVNRLRRSATPT
jgi:hypothetical protein